jgi:hypothetical protein
LPMNAPEADQQIVSGVYQLENGQWRWISRSATFLLKPPPEPAPLTARFTIPDSSPARQVTLTLNDHVVASQTYASPGTYALSSAPVNSEGKTAQVTITLDKTFSAPGDSRDLGVILSDVGFR